MEAFISTCKHIKFINSLMLSPEHVYHQFGTAYQLYLNPDSLPLSTSGKLTRPPQLFFPFPTYRHLLTLWSVYFYSWWKPQYWLKAPFIFSPGSLCYNDVYRLESGRCRTLPFFLTFLSQTHYSTIFKLC